MARVRNKQHLPPKPKLTKEDRRAKYTQLARDRKDRSIAKAVGRTQTCFQCRQKGHSLAFCPNNNNNDNAIGSQVDGKKKQDKSRSQVVVPEKICYKCGSSDHALYSCPDYQLNDTDLPFATCFVCQAQGHLASQCSQNEKGVFPNGGECKRCGSNRHVSSKCPNRNDSNKKKKKQQDDDGSDDDGFDVNELLEGDANGHADASSSKVASGEGKAVASSVKKRKVVNF